MFFFHSKSFLRKGPLTAKIRKKKKKNHILGYISFSFEIGAHLYHLFAETTKISLIDNFVQKMSQTQS